MTWLDRAAAVAGFALLVSGVALVHPPSALMVAGVLLMGAAIRRVRG